MANEDRFVRRRGTRDLFDDTVQIIQERALSIAILTVAYYLVVLILLYVLFGPSFVSLILPSEDSSGMAGPFGADSDTPAVPLIIAILGFTLATLIYLGGLIRLVASHFSSDVPLTYEDAVVLGLRNLPQLIGVTLVELLALIALTVLPALAGQIFIFFSLPAALWFAIRWAFAWQAVVLEAHGVYSALTRSWNLVKGSWGRVFGIFLVLASAYFVVSLVATVDPTGLVGFILAVVLTPIQYIVATLLYGDLRARFDESRTITEPI